jgi:hypothetical protein
MVFVFPSGAPAVRPDGGRPPRNKQFDDVRSRLRRRSDVRYRLKALGTIAALLIAMTAWSLWVLSTQG